MKKNYALAFITTLLICASLNAQTTIIKETFDGSTKGKYLNMSTWGDNKGYPNARFSFSENGHLDNSSFRIFVKKISEGTPFKISVDFLDFKLKKRTKYRVSLWIRTKANNDKISASIFSSKKSGSKKREFTPLLLKDLEFKGQDIWKQLEFTFDTSKNNKKTDLNHVGLGLGFNTRVGKFYIDKILLEEL